LRWPTALRIVLAVTGTSVIVSSYNQPNALALVFAGLLTQTHRIDELLIGDDGSQDDTRELVQEFAKRAPFPVVYETQEDRGFRKSRALNNALRRAQHEHIMFLDGDCVPPPAWAANYARSLTSGVPFATAGYVLMDLQRTQQLTPAQIAAGRIDDGITQEQRRAFDKIHRKEVLYRVLRQRKKPKILGGNWAATRACLVAVNGFDEKYDGFGKEDSDIRNRLRNAGYRGRSLWDHNWVYHCSHDFDPRRNLPEVVRSEPDYDYYLSRVRAKYCEHGLVAPTTPNA
jgi:glycosyltransferase involved in cell wall biosynthesis